MAHLARRHILYHQQAVALLHGGSHAVLQAHIVLVRRNQFVDDHLHIVILVSVQLHAGQCFAHFAVHPDIEVALLAHLLEQVLVVSLTVAHQGSQDIDALALIIAQNQLQDLLFGVLHHLLAGQIGVSLARTGIEQT